MSVCEINALRRTIRKFQQKPISNELLNKFIDCARICPSAANMQPLKYKIIAETELCAKLYPHLKWAGYLQNGAPAAGERPVAYILIAQDLTIRSADASVDVGAAAMTITLCAQEEGIASCWIGSVDRSAVCAEFEIAETLKLHLVLALGYPAQESCLSDMHENNCKYYLDENRILHVPKRRLQDILF